MEMMRLNRLIRTWEMEYICLSSVDNLLGGVTVVFSFLFMKN